MKRVFRWFRHCYERIKYGVSYRDAWNVDIWLADKLATCLENLDKNTISYPMQAEKLHSELCEILGRKYVPTEDELKMSSDKRNLKLYHEDLKTMIRLLREYDEDKCSMQNPFKFSLHWEFKDDPNHKGCSITNFVGTEEEKAETEKYREFEERKYEYRMKCFRDALKIVSLYLDHLWD